MENIRSSVVKTESMNKNKIISNEIYKNNCINDENSSGLIE